MSDSFARSSFVNSVTSCDVRPIPDPADIECGEMEEIQVQEYDETGTEMLTESARLHDEFLAFEAATGQVDPEEYATSGAFGSGQDDMVEGYDGPT